MSYPALIWNSLIEALEAKDREITDLEDRLDPGNYCCECGYIENEAHLQRETERYRRTISSLERDIDEEGHRKWDAEEEGDKCKRENKRLKGMIY